MKKFTGTLMKYIGLLLCCAMLSGCTGLFFYPMTPHVSTPDSLGYSYEDIFLEAEDGTRLHAWLIEPKPPVRGTVYFLHGNAENISTHYRATVWLLESGYQVFALDYRGYGLSEGEPDVPEVFTDIEAGAQWLDENITSNTSKALPLYLLGQSLGGTLAIRYAAMDENFSTRFDGLITEAAFPRFDTIARDVASRHWLTWSAQYPAQWLIPRNHDPLDVIDQLAGVPKLMIHSADDDIIPYHFGQQLFDAAPEPKIGIVASGPHIRAAADPALRQAVLDFMQDPSSPEIPQAQ